MSIYLGPAAGIENSKANPAGFKDDAAELVQSVAVFLVAPFLNLHPPYFYFTFLIA